MIWWWWAVAQAGVLGVPVVVPASSPDEVRVVGEALVAEHWAVALEGLEGLPPRTGERAYWATVAHYELGEVLAAERASGDGLQRDPGDVRLRVLHALALADLGRGDEALGVLRLVGGDAPADWRARAGLLEGVVHADLGDRVAAEAAIRRARELAQAAGHAALIRRADEQLADVTDRVAADVVGRVGEALSRGDLTGARAVATTSDLGRRGVVQERIARAMIDRVQRQWSRAAEGLKEAVEVAARAGLLRERIAAELELGRVLLLAGEVEAGKASLDAALAHVRGTSFVVREIDVRAARVRLAVRQGRVADARRDLEAARALAGRVSHPQVAPRLAELGAAMAVADGQTEQALAALDDARQAWSGLGFHAEAARVGAEQVRVASQAGLDARTYKASAAAAFTAAGDGLGVVHVAISEGLGLVDAGALDQALLTFAEAARRARQAGALDLAAIAEEDVAQALLGLGHGPEAVARARALGMEDALERHTRFVAARQAYADGRQAFDAGRHAEALGAFQRAAAGFAANGDVQAEQQVRRAEAWAAWNVAVGQPPEVAWTRLNAIAQQASALDEPELEVRARAAAAIAQGRAGKPGAADALEGAAILAREAGLIELAAQCFGARAEMAGSWDGRVAAARAAHALEPRMAGPWALYEVAYAAWQRDDAALVIELLDLAASVPDELVTPVRELREAAAAWLSDAEGG